MVFIWRGAGIIVPIFFFVAAWLTSYSFEDTRFGNSSYLGWTMIWSGIASLVIGGLLAASNMKDPETGEKPPKSYHDFMWIPVWIWGIVLIAGGIWFTSKGGDDNEESDISYEDVIPDEVEYEGEKTIHFYNPTEDTTLVVVKDEDGDVRMSENIPPLHTRYLPFQAGVYTVESGNDLDEVEVLGSIDKDQIKYDDMWYVVGGGLDLILIEVTETCNLDITRGDIREINWKEKIISRQSGKYFDVQINENDNSSATVKSPGVMLPTKLESQ